MFPLILTVDINQILETFLEEERKGRVYKQEKKGKEKEDKKRGTKRGKRSKLDKKKTSLINNKLWVQF